MTSTVTDVLQTSLSISPAPPECMMEIAVQVDSSAALRQVAKRVCGESIEFIRTEVYGHGRRVRVWLCVSPWTAALLMSSVMHTLPDAEFGKFLSVAPHAR